MYAACCGMGSKDRKSSAQRETRIFHTFNSSAAKQAEKRKKIGANAEERSPRKKCFIAHAQ
jgi:hypothetical protein